MYQNSYVYARSSVGKHKLYKHYLGLEPTRAILFPDIYL